MKVCNKCKVEREDDKFDKYWHSGHQNHYVRRICNPCMREGYKQYKLKIKEQERLKDIKNNPDYKQCTECKEYKLLPEFYLSATRKAVKMCKPCYVIHYKNKAQEKIEDKGGSDSYYKEPNRYFDEEQKKNVFMVMEAFGWIFDELTGIWNKPGVKENGVFINMVFENKPKRIYTPGGGRKLKKGVWNSVDKIIKLIEEGHKYSDVAETFCCSHTLIRKVVSDYRNEKRTD